MKKTTTLATLIAAVITAAADTPRSLPQPATSFGAAILDSSLYVYGGNTGKAHEFHRDCVSGTFHRWNLTGSKNWEQLQGGVPLLGASLVAYKGRILRIGGLQPKNAKGEKASLFSSPDVLRFEPGKSAWSALPSLPTPRSSHDTTILGNLLIVGGGWNLNGDDGEGTGAKWHTTVLALDLTNPSKGWSSHAQPFERRALAAVPDGERVWFIGGMDSNDKPSLAVEWWNPSTGIWGKGPDLPDGAMAGFGVAACNAGGNIIASPLSGRLLRLSADRSHWEQVGTLAKPRFFHRLLALDGEQLLVVGGSSRKEQIPALEIVKIGAISAITPPSEKASPPSNSEPAIKKPQSAGTESWPQWRGPNRDGTTSTTAWNADWPPEGLKAIWRRNVGLGMSSPVVAEGRVIMHGNDGSGTDSIVALDAATGDELWRCSVPCKSDAHEMPIVPRGPGATPTINGDKVFALTREGQLLCIDFISGRLQWKQSLSRLGGKRPVYGYTQSPLVTSGLVILDIGGTEESKTSTTALDRSTGAVKWQRGSGEAGYSSARVFRHAGRDCIAMLKGEGLEIRTLLDGELIATHRTSARDFSNAATPVFINEHILVSNTGTDPAALLSIDGKEISVRWTHKQFAQLFNSAIHRDGLLFGFNEKRRGHHEFTAIHSADGATHWVSDSIPTSTFILAGEHWIFLTREGELATAPASKEAPVLRAKFRAFDGKCYATPAIADGRIFVRSNEGDVIAFDAQQR